MVVDASPIKPAGPAIYYICFIPPKTGGELVNLQHVAALNQHGVRAVALVNQSANVKDVPQALSFVVERLVPQRSFGADDVMVIPEFYREAHQHFRSQACKRVLHTQGPFLTFRGFDTLQELNAAGFSAGLTCSSFAKELMLSMGASLPWQVVTPYVLPIFRRDQPQKKLQIAYMPDKRPKEALVIRALFQAKYPQWAEVPWVPIAGMSRQACADVMAESAVFASMSYLEGLGLPPLEAMASGCLVCGFVGHGGRDYASPENGLWVAEGDHIGFADALADLLGLASTVAPDSHEFKLAQQMHSAGLQTAEQYAQARFERELLDAWLAILGVQWAKYQLHNG
jgi:hypothetical protein